MNFMTTLGYGKKCNYKNNMLFQKGEQRTSDKMWLQMHIISYSYFINLVSWIFCQSFSIFFLIVHKIVQFFNMNS